MATHGIQRLITALECFRDEIIRCQGINTNKAIDSNYSRGHGICDELLAAVKQCDDEEIETKYDLLCRYIVDCLPWEGNILEASTKVDSAFKERKGDSP